jgi:hypothetical protein
MPDRAPARAAQPRQPLRKEVFARLTAQSCCETRIRALQRRLLVYRFTRAGVIDRDRSQ